MKKLWSKKWTKVFAVILLVLGTVVLIVKLLSLRTYDPDNPRSLPNGYLMSHTVTVMKPPSEVFDFITYRMAEYNLSIAKAHDRFEITHGDGLTEGAVFVSEEYQEDEGVKNTYVVQKAIPDSLIFYSSTPSLIYTKKDGEWVQTGKCNAYVYFDMEGDSGNTTLTQTLVIEMPDFFTKFMIDLINSGQESNEWQDHLVEELEGLKKAIELQD